jgi:heptosyltransferase-2
MKILVIRFSSIGDIVLCSGAIRCIKKTYPDAEIHWATKAKFHSIMEVSPYIDKIFSMENSVNEIIEKTSQHKYDFVIDLHKNIRSRRLTISTKSKVINFDKKNLAKYLKVRFKSKRIVIPHLADRYFDALKTINVQDDGQGLDFFINELYISGDMLHFATHPYVVLAIGGSKFTKKLPYQKLFEVCEGIDYKIIVLGDNNDNLVGEKLNNAFPTKVINLCGQTNLHQSAWYVKHAKCVVTHDTGIMHIAAAFKKKIASIWGSSTPDFGMYPYYGYANQNIESLSKQFIVENLGCQPCSKIGYDSCPKKHFNCMNMQNTEQIVNFVNNVLQHVD